ncbi:MAG: hypothetical protein QM504_11010 [Pseudomonadota bacterium]
MNSKDKKKILDWIKNPERTAKQGKNLYAAYGRKQFISRLIHRLENDDKVIDILDIQFKMMLGLSVLPPQVDSKPVEKDEAPEKGKSGEKILNTDLGLAKSVEPKKRELVDPYPEPDQRPDELKTLYEQKNVLYVEAKNLNSTLIAKGDEMDKHEEGTDEYNVYLEERREIAKTVIAHYNQINVIWKQIDYFKEHGSLPAPDVIQPKLVIKADKHDPIAMDKRYRTLGTYISKAKKDPERNQEKLKEYYIESNEIAKKLNEMAGEEKYKMRSHDATPPADKGKK